jgi:hypothetical protein
VPSWYDGATVLAGPTEVELHGVASDLVLLPDDRVGYATATAFLPVGRDGDLEKVTVNAGDARGTSVVSLDFADGEVRETVPESAAVVSRRLRAAGYTVSAAKLGEADPPPPEQPLDYRDEPVPGAPAVTAPVVDAEPVALTKADPDREPEPAVEPVIEPVTEPAPASEPAPPTRSTPVQPPVATEPAAPAAPAAKKKRRFNAGRFAGLLGRGTLAILRTLVLVGGGAVAGILIVYVVLVLTKANASNDLVRFFARASKPLAWKFKDLFTPKTFRANITENYGLAAIVYLVVTLAVARLLRRPGKP